MPIRVADRRSSASNIAAEVNPSQENGTHLQYSIPTPATAVASKDNTTVTAPPFTVALIHTTQCFGENYHEREHESQLLIGTALTISCLGLDNQLSARCTEYILRVLGLSWRPCYQTHSVNGGAFHIGSPVCLVGGSHPRSTSPW